MIRKSPHISLLISIIAQLIGFMCGFIVQELYGAPVTHIVLHSVVAALLARCLGVSLAWQLVNAALPFGVILSLQLDLPSLVWVGVCLLLLIYTPTFFTKVPFYPSARPVYDAVLEALPRNTSISFLDAGCGSAALLRFLARHRPESSFVGVEINPIVFIFAKLTSLSYRNVTVHFRSLWKIDLGSYDVVYTFLAPPFMPAIWKKAKDEMAKGTLLLSNSFEAPAKASAVREVGKGRQDALFIYKMR